MAVPPQLREFAPAPVQPRYLYNTRVGPFHIVEHKGSYHPVFGGYDLGAYLTAEHAASDLARGWTFKIEGVKDTAALGIPCDLQRWDKVGPNDYR